MLGNLLGIESCLRSGFALEEVTDITRPLECNAVSKYKRGWAYCRESNRDHGTNLGTVSAVTAASLPLRPGSFRKV